MLAGHGVDFIVVGGVAAVLGGAPISTFDLDIVHARDPTTSSASSRPWATSTLVTAIPPAGSFALMRRGSRATDITC